MTSPRLLPMAYLHGLPQPYSTADKASFAYTSARERWPIILTAAIDDLHQAVSAINDVEKADEGKVLIASVSKLKYEVQHDRALTVLSEDQSVPDLNLYNKDLSNLHDATWCNAPWLYSECYLYRRLAEIFRHSEHWKTYDVFRNQKLSSLLSSKSAIVELAARWKEVEGRFSEFSGQEVMSRDEETILFHEMCDICLWGNATDLSLLTSMKFDELQKLQGAAARKESEKNIIVNDLSTALEILQEARSSGPQSRRVDIVLDNAGFELFVDLFLAGFLLFSGLADTVVLRPKDMPWFVSDVTPADFSTLFNAVGNPSEFFSSGGQIQLGGLELSNLQSLFAAWTRYHASGQLIIRTNPFWTHGTSFHRMPENAPDLLEDLQRSELVIFKGDLNYRKLTGDVMWDPTTPFQQALGPLGRGSRLRILALRTCKADVVVGLPSGEDERLRHQSGDDNSGPRRWAWTGKWAVVQCSDGSLT